jgi:hypothetical protein
VKVEWKIGTVKVNESKGSGGIKRVLFLTTKAEGIF